MKFAKYSRENVLDFVGGVVGGLVVLFEFFMLNSIMSSGADNWYASGGVLWAAIIINVLIFIFQINLIIKGRKRLFEETLRRGSGVKLILMMTSFIILLGITLLIFLQTIVFIIYFLGAK